MVDLWFFPVKNESKPFNVMTCHEHGGPSKVNKYECEEYEKDSIMSEHLTEDLRQPKMI